jgi:glycosyltransferase involved in cell wall biosynthesis
MEHAASAPASFESCPRLPDVTVVVPTLNRATLLEQTLRSLLDQTASFRIVVVDDGSTDSTRGVCAAMAPSVEYVRNESSLGLFRNWNRALGLVDTEFVAIFHDDDVYAPEIVAAEVDLLRVNPDVVMVHTGCHFIDDEGTVKETHVPGWPARMEGAEFRRALAGRLSSPVFAPSVMLRTSAIRAAGGFNESLRVPGDVEAWMAVARAGSIGFIPRPLVGFRMRGRYANVHGEFDWGVIDEILEVAARTYVDVHGSLSKSQQRRTDLYLVRFLMRELYGPGIGDYRSVTARHGSRSTVRLAKLLPWLRPLRVVLVPLRPVARVAVRLATQVGERRVTDTGAAR